MAEPTQRELTVELRGEMKEGFARVEGTIKALAEEVRAANLARAAENIEMRKDVDDHEARIRLLEARKTVSPMGLWSVVAGGVTIAIAAVALFI